MTHDGMTDVYDLEVEETHCFFANGILAHNCRRLISVGPIMDWFEQNPKTRWHGITATPKRGDGVSIGDQMFPGISLDYPLYSLTKPCAVRDGWAVPYIQRYIEVEDVDFRSISKIGDDFDEAELERRLGEERSLAKLVTPLLDMVEDRRTLIFSPGVEMAKNVARFINARAEAVCQCGKRRWWPRLLIGDGATCDCGRLVDPADVTTWDEQARELDGNSPETERKSTYRDHQAGKFRFLSVCALCREGYNDPDISCVAVFRPVTKKCSSLAEQMKGRGCRPPRHLVKDLMACKSAEERVAMLEPHACLIVDLVGITGLADCASTAEIYAEGLPDQVVERAREILTESTEGIEVEDAIEQARREDEEEAERIRLEREHAEQAARELAQKRAKADAQAAYTTHEVGYGDNLDPDHATDKQYKFMAFLGMQIDSAMHRKKAGRIINQLRLRTPPEEVARTNRLQEGTWRAVGPSDKALGFARWKGVPTGKAKTGFDLSMLIDARLNTAEFREKKIAEIAKARTDEELTIISQDIAIVRGCLPDEMLEAIVAAGKQRRSQLSGPIVDDNDQESFATYW